MLVFPSNISFLVPSFLLATDFTGQVVGVIGGNTIDCPAQWTS